MFTNKKDFNIANFIKPAPVINAACRLPDLALELTASKTHLAIMTDEAGKVNGVVSLCDIQGMIFA